jgi:hypothetical protein
VDGTVSDPIVVDSDTVPTKDWFNATVLESIVKWKYAGGGLKLQRPYGFQLHLEELDRRA